MNRYILNGKPISVKPEDVDYFEQLNPNAEKIGGSLKKPQQSEQWLQHLHPEIAQILQGLPNIKDNVVQSLRNFATKELPAAIAQTYKKVAFDDLYDEEELKRLKTLDPNATYEDPMGDPTGFKTNADKIKYLEEYKNTSPAKQEQKINKYLTKTYKELEIYNKYLRKDVGEGIVKGVKQGDVSDIVLGVFNASASMVETVAPAMITGGWSLPFQITAPMITSYNQQKAERIYGKDDPDAVKKLLENREDEITVPASLGLLASGFEYVGYKGITNYMLGKAATGRVASLLLTGNREGITELGQSGIDEVNIALAQDKKGLDVAKAFIDGVFSEKGLESYLQGFIGGTSMSAGGRAINRALRSDNTSVKELNNLVNNLAELNIAKNSATNPTAKEAIEVEMKEAEQALKNYVTNKRKIAEILNEDQKQNLINAINEKDNITSKVESLRNQLNNNEISSKEFGYAFKSLNNQDKRLTEQIELINESAKQQLLVTGLEVAKEEGQKVGLKQKLFETKEEYAALFGEKGSKEYNEALKADGHISDDGKTYFVNMQTARETGAIAVGTHELLHGIIGNSFSKLSTEVKKKLNKDFLNLLSKKDRETVLERLSSAYEITGDDVFTTEELYTAFSDVIIDGDVKFNEGVFGKIKNSFEEVLRKLSSAGYFSKESFLYRKEFGNARQAYNFVKDYSLTIKKTGKVTERAKEFAKEDPGVKKTRMSRSKLVDTINDLQQDATTKADFQKPEIFNKVFEAVQSGGAINNYIRSLKMSPEKTQETIDAVTDRLINFDPAAKRKDGTVIGPKGLGEFIMANVGFGKLVAAKKLAVEAEKKKRTTRIDDPDIKDIPDDTPTPAETVDQKQPKLRKLNNFDIELENGLVDAEIIAEVEALIEENPSDLKARMEKLILNDIRKKLDNAVGKIAKDPKTGKRGPTPEYESFIRNEYDEVVQSLGIKTIRTSYKKWFKQEKTGVKKYKNIDPETGKVSNFVKDVQVNTTNKREYIRWFLESNERNLTERRTALLRRIARRKAEVAIDNYIEANSNNIDAVTDAKLRALTRTAENIQDEQTSFDSVKFSITVKQKVNDYYKTGNFDTKGHALEQVIIDLLKSYNLPTKYLKVAVDYATEKGGIADINLEVLGEALRIEVKLNENVPMGSVLASNYNLKTKVLKLAKSSMDKSLPFDQIMDLVRDDVVNLINVYNGKVTAYNNKNGTNEPLMDVENPTGHRMVESIYNEMVNEGVTGKIFQNSLFVSPNAQPLIDHYLNKFAGAVKAIEIFGKGLYSFVENSVLGPNVPYILDMARVETHIRVFNSGRVKQTVKGKRKLVTNKVGDGYVRFQLQFQNTLLKNSLKTPKKPVSLTRKEDMLFNLSLPMKEGLAPELESAVKMSRSTKKPTRGITVLDFDDTLATTKSLVKYTTLDGETGTLNAEEYASTYEDLLHKHIFRAKLTL